MASFLELLKKLEMDKPSVMPLAKCLGVMMKIKTALMTVKVVMLGLAIS